MRDAAAATVMRDYYDVLGVERDADGDTIKRAFRARARELHPDVSADPGAADSFAELSKAYGVLSKPSSRRLYDNFGYGGRGNGWFAPDAARGARRVVRRPVRPVAEVLVDELEAQRGVRRKVRWERAERCSACAGERLIQIDDCPDCRGRGRVFTAACAACGGAGAHIVRESGEVQVPPGAADGDLLQLQDLARFVTGRVRAAPPDRVAARFLALTGLCVALVL